MSNLLTPLPKRHEAAAPDAGAVALRSRTLFALLLTELLGACGGGGGNDHSVGATTGGSDVPAAPAVPPVPPVPPKTWNGHYVGTVKIANVTYFGDAIFTQDGAVRLYIGGPAGNAGAIQVRRPASSAQFVGTIDMRDGQGSGSGLIIGQECAINAAGRFCGQPATAEINASVQMGSGASANADLQGEIRITTASGTETWLLDLGLWSDPTLATTPWSGQLKETLAEFASASDVIMNFDGSGLLTFQSANSGCVGNGALVPHLDGAADTFDVTLTMENCNAAYAYLNGRYDGLALYTASSYWDYDSVLRMWLSKPAGQTPPAALTTLGEPL
jgi:hypothetical protein